MLEYPPIPGPSPCADAAVVPMERVDALRNELAERSAAGTAGCLEWLLASLCQLVGADNGLWIGSVRLIEDCRVDLAMGWRPGALQVLRPLPGFLAEPIHDRECGPDHDVMVRLATRAGRFRAARLRDLEPADWFLGADYQQHYRAQGYGDALYVVAPVNQDAESCIALFRSSGRPGFSEAERDRVACALTGLDEVHRRLLLGQGLSVADAPLAPVEREVVQGLLLGLSDLAIAQRCGCSVEAVRARVPVVCRRFGVDDRAGLLAVWQGGCRGGT